MGRIMSVLLTIFSVSLVFVFAIGAGTMAGLGMDSIVNGMPWPNSALFIVGTIACLFLGWIGMKALRRSLEWLTI